MKIIWVDTPIRNRYFVEGQEIVVCWRGYTFNLISFVNLDSFLAIRLRVRNRSFNVESNDLCIFYNFTDRVFYKIGKQLAKM